MKQAAREERGRRLAAGTGVLSLSVIDRESRAERLARETLARSETDQRHPRWSRSGSEGGSGVVARRPNLNGEAKRMRE